MARNMYTIHSVTTIFETHRTGVNIIMCEQQKKSTWISLHLSAWPVDRLVWHTKDKGHFIPLLSSCRIMDCCFVSSLRTWRSSVPWRLRRLTMTWCCRRISCWWRWHRWRCVVLRSTARFSLALCCLAAGLPDCDPPRSPMRPVSQEPAQSGSWNRTLAQVSHASHLTCRQTPETRSHLPSRLLYKLLKHDSSSPTRLPDRLLKYGSSSPSRLPDRLLKPNTVADVTHISLHCTEWGKVWGVR